MKKYHFFALIFLGLLTGFASDVRGSDTKQLLERIENTKKASGWANPSAAIESGVGGLSKLPDFATLKDQAKANWSYDLDHLSELAPSRYSKTVLFISFQTLPKSDYIAMATKAVDLANEGEIDSVLLRWILIPSDGNVRGVLTDNFKSPDVVKVWQNSKKAFASDERMLAYVNDVLNGTVADNNRVARAEGVSGDKPPSIDNHSQEQLPNSFSERAHLMKISSAYQSGRLWIWVAGLFFVGLIGAVYLFKFRSN